MKFSVFQLSRRGGRKKNEDRMGYCYTRDAALFVLADGMGGHVEGEVAAQIALQSMAAQFQAEAKPTVRKPAEFLSNALMNAHHQILRYAGDTDMPDTPRTTLVAVIVQEGHATWVHCGDSQRYMIRNGSLLVRTRDHSYMEQGEHYVTKSMHINRNVLFTCLGSPSRPIFDVSLPMLLQQGDRILLCSDGLWGTMSDEDVVKGVSNIDKPLAECVPDLVEEALRRGGPGCDNTTALALSWEMPATEGAEVVTDSILDGVFASTIQAAGWDSETENELNEDDIERSIAEINAAIQRGGPLKKNEQN